MTLLDWIAVAVVLLAALGGAVQGFVWSALSLAGLVTGALVGLAAIWVLGAMALQLPGQAQLRQAVQRSELLQRLNAIVPPRSLLHALGRIDPFPRLAGPPLPTATPDS